MFQGYRWLGSLFSLFFLLANVFSLVASPLFTGLPAGRLLGPEAEPWAVIESHSDPHPGYPEEPFHPKLKHFYPQVVRAFGTPTPHSRQFLLHCAPGYDRPDAKGILLLIPGANDDATRRFGHPLSTQHPDHLKVGGMMQYMVRRGYAVFAISFSHFHGDNLYQGEQVANALKRIASIRGRFQTTPVAVDVVTYSKGAMAARCYAQSIFRDFQGSLEPSLFTPYRGDIGRIIFVCGPLGGLDLPFRSYNYNLFVFQGGHPAPLGASALLFMGQWKSTARDYICAPGWTGQQQMLYPQEWLGIPDGPESFTPDFNHSGWALKHGGTTALLSSRGIDRAMALGGNLIERLNREGLPPAIEFAALAGTHSITYDESYPLFKWPLGAVMNDISDGLVYLKSAHHVEGLVKSGAKLLKLSTLAENHIDLSRSHRAYQFVEEMVKR